MKQEQNVEFEATALLERFKKEYADLLRSTPFSLEKLFAPEHFSFGDFCQGFSAHPQSDELKWIIQVFGENHRIWLPNAKHHVTCALFLYPNGKFERMLTMMKNLTLGFYLNDIMGRDTFKFLPVEQQEVSRKIIEGMSSLDDTLYIPTVAHTLELVNVEVLKEFKDTSPEEWFSQFLRLYCYHIGITHTDGNTTATGHIPGIQDYMDRRCHLGGVHHILMWIEYSDGQFLDWELLTALDIAQSLKRLHWVTAAFAGLSNDLFSFEKEVIDHGSDSNLVMIIALNQVDLPLKEAIFRASEIVKNLLTELLELLDFIKAMAERFTQTYPAHATKLNTHLYGIVRCVQAIWLWHCHSQRYKRPFSLWIETRLGSETVATKI